MAFFADSVPLLPLLLNVLVQACVVFCLPGERSTQKATLSLFARFISLEEFHR